ncbi:MAG: helix-turn-helix domain-containing protein [Myxococcota bacterium]
MSGDDDDDDDPAWVDAEEACRLAGIKRATLYAYVSRGQVRRRRPPRGRRHRYARADLVTSPPSGTAASPSRAPTSPAWPAPSGRIIPRPSLIALADEGTFEATCLELWDADVSWPLPTDGTSVNIPHPLPSIDSICAAMLAHAADPARHRPSRAARSEVAATLMTSAVVGEHLGTDPEAARWAGAQPTLAAAFLAGRGVRPRARATSLVDAALSLSVGADGADRAGPNAAREAMARGVDPHRAAVIGLAASTLRGFAPEPRFAATARWFAKVRTSADAEAEVAHHRALRLALPGFDAARGGLPEALIERASSLLDRRSVFMMQRLLALAGEGGQGPDVTVGLLVVCRALGLEPSAAVSLFALARLATILAEVVDTAAPAAAP